MRSMVVNGRWCEWRLGAAETEPPRGLVGQRSACRHRNRIRSLVRLRPEPLSSLYRRRSQSLDERPEATRTNRRYASLVADVIRGSLARMTSRSSEEIRPGLATHITKSLGRCFGFGIVVRGSRRRLRVGRVQIEWLCVRGRRGAFDRATRNQLRRYPSEHHHGTLPRLDAIRDKTERRAQDVSPAQL